MRLRRTKVVLTEDDDTLNERNSLAYRIKAIEAEIEVMARSTVAIATNKPKPVVLRKHDRYSS